MKETILMLFVACSMYCVIAVVVVAYLTIKTKNDVLTGPNR